ncbi:hypothetical protein ACWGHM_24715 [Streptomyces sp. NPDC054904]|uniref:hypothetical protein n=1 Tax=Streptomyces sp. NPDC017949 TaxID=3365020 RepID=UPI0037A5B495
MTTSINTNMAPRREEEPMACPPPYLHTLAPFSPPSRELLDRARAGWERFVTSFEESSDG